MSQEPYKLLTLVIPTYNMEKYLTKCLESVTAPCIPPTLEVIVVNDGSKDRSLEIMKAFQQKRPDIIRIIDKENGHYGSCINAGLQMAKGKYFRPLDADDWMDTEVLSKLLNVLKNCDTDLFITLRTEYKIDKNNRHIVTHFPFRNVEYNKIYDISSFNISEHTYGDESNMHSMTYKTEILKQANLRHIEGICYTDFQYCFLPIDHIKDFIIFDLYLYYYFIGREEQSTSVQSIKRNLSHICKVINSMIHHLDSQIHQNPTILANQIHFIDKALNIYVISLRWQRKITEQNYPEIFNVIDAVDRYHIQNRILNKPYFRPWRKLKTRKVLNLTLTLYRWAHIRKFRKMGM